MVPPPPPEAVAADTDAPACHSLPPDKDAPPRAATHRCKYIPWRQLMRRGLNLDVETCPRCGGRMKLIALVQDAENVARYLRHLGLPTEVPPMAPLSGARACPPCPCPTRPRRARRPPEGHRSGRAASSADATCPNFTTCIKDMAAYDCTLLGQGTHPASCVSVLLY